MHLPGMIKKWRPWAETEDARTEAQHFIERWNTALAAGRAGPVRSGEDAVSDLHIIAKRGRQFASIIANSPEGERWIKANEALPQTDELYGGSRLLLDSGRACRDMP